jgi:hypothetical protein
MTVMDDLFLKRIQSATSISDIISGLGSLKTSGCYRRLTVQEAALQTIELFQNEGVLEELWEPAQNISKLLVNRLSGQNVTETDIVNAVSPLMTLEDQKNVGAMLLSEPSDKFAESCIPWPHYDVQKDNALQFSILESQEQMCRDIKSWEDAPLVSKSFLLLSISLWLSFAFLVLIKNDKDKNRTHLFIGIIWAIITFMVNSNSFAMAFGQYAIAGFASLMVTKDTWKKAVPYLLVVNLVEMFLPFLFLFADKQNDFGILLSLAATRGETGHNITETLEWTREALLISVGGVHGLLRFMPSIIQGVAVKDTSDIKDMFTTVYQKTQLYAKETLPEPSRIKQITASGETPLEQARAPRASLHPLKIPEIFQTVVDGVVIYADPRGEEVVEEAFEKLLEKGIVSYTDPSNRVFIPPNSFTSEELRRCKYVTVKLSERLSIATEDRDVGFDDSINEKLQRVKTEGLANMPSRRSSQRLRTQSRG